MVGMIIVFIYAVMGGMKGITYTQIAQYVIMIIAYTIPAIFISFMLTGNPVPQLGLGSKINDGTYLLDTLDKIVTDLGFKEYTTHARLSLFNMFFYTLSLMIGTAGLPHVIMRFFTVPSVKAARLSAGWALSGDPKDIYKTDKKIMEMFSEDEALCRWITMAQEQVQFQGLPARICWLGYGDRAKFGLALNEMVRSGELSAPIVIGRDHLDCGSVASPNRETESMKDGTDAVADWPLLNAMVNIAGGATWVSFHHGGGVGMGYSLHAGQVIVADGTDEMDSRLNSVLTNDPGMGIFRHVDAGYENAIENAKKWNVDVPMIEKG